MADLDKKVLVTACDYINANAITLHGIEAKDAKNLGPDITPDDVVSASETDDEVVLIVSRGIAGSPKYRLSKAVLEVQRQLSATKATTNKPASEKSPKAEK